MFFIHSQFVVLIIGYRLFQLLLLLLVLLVYNPSGCSDFWVCVFVINWLFFLLKHFISVVEYLCVYCLRLISLGYASSSGCYLFLVS